MDTLEAASLRADGTSWQKLSVSHYVQKKGYFCWSGECVGGGVYREKTRCCTVRCTYSIYTSLRGGYWSSLTYMYIHNPTAFFIFFIFYFFYAFQKGSDFAAGTCLPRSPTDRSSALFPFFFSFFLFSSFPFFSSFLFSPLFFFRT